MNSRPLVNVTFDDGHSRGVFLLDTGSDVSLISNKRIPKTTVLKTPPNLTSFTGTSVTIQGLQSVQFSIQEDLYSWNFFVVEIHQTCRYDGILGWDFCQRFPSVLSSFLGSTSHNVNCSEIVYSVDSQSSSDTSSDISESPTLESSVVLPTDVPSGYAALISEHSDLFSTQLRRSKLGEHRIVLIIGYPPR